MLKIPYHIDVHMHPAWNPANRKDIYANARVGILRKTGHIRASFQLPQMLTRAFLFLGMGYSYAPERPCVECGQPFRPRTDNVKKGNGRYCSKSCGAIARQRSRMRFKSCEYCGERFHAYRKALRFCSRTCKVRKEPPNFNPNREEVRLRRRLTSFCHSAISRCMKDKNGRTFDVLGYTSLELRAHLEMLFTDGMTWENYGRLGDVWHIDHIRPISSFHPDTPPREISALSNLQPLWAKDNLSKRAKWDAS